MQPSMVYSASLKRLCRLWVLSQQQEKKQEDELNNETLSFLVGDENPTPRIDKAVEREDQQDAQVYALGDAAVRSAMTLLLEKASSEMLLMPWLSAATPRSLHKKLLHKFLDLDTFMSQ